MVFASIKDGNYLKKSICEFELDNLEFSILNCNILKDEIKILTDSIKIKDNKLNLYKCNFLIYSVDICDVSITEILSQIPTDKIVNNLQMNELRYEYIISFKDSKNKKLHNIYLKNREVFDYVFIKK